MKRVAWLLAAGVVAVGGTLGWAAYLQRAAPPPPEVHAVVQAMRRAQAAPPPFTEAEFNDFLTAARKAEAIDDPLQRCLAYPEPPGLHWSSTVTSAYCHYLLDPAVTLAQARDWIETGHVAELEAKLAQAKDVQLSHTGTAGWLDATYNHIFRDGSADTRALLDAWKRQAPNSAYAFAASGVAYVAMAQKQRGGDYAAKTPQSAFEAMHRLLELARTDLDRAVELDPQMTPAYGAMVYAATLDSDDAYGASAVRRALKVDPANFPVYVRVVWGSQPKWGGSAAQMQRVVDAAQRHAAQNPLLRLLLSERTGGEQYVEDCSCDEEGESKLYREVFAEAPSFNMLMSAGWAASHRIHPQLSVIYRSELLRFDPTHLGHRQSRAFDLILLGQTDWGLAEGEALVQLQPQDETAYDVRGQAHRMLNQPAAAVADFEQALRINPSDAWTLAAVGDVYLNQTHEWEKGWAVANRLLQLDPDNPQGWFLRASIQKEQPRDGLDQTIADFQARFGQDPSKQWLVVQMQALKASAKPPHS